MRHAPYISIANAKLKTQLSSFLPHKFSHFRELSRSQRHISITYCNAIIYTNQPSTHDIGGIFCTYCIFIHSLYIHYTSITRLLFQHIFSYKRPHRGRPYPLAKLITPAIAGVHSPSQSQQRPHRGRPLPLAKSTTPATRASLPIAKLITPAPRASIPPRKICHICRRQMSLPIAKSITSAAGRCLSPSPNLSHLPQADVSPPRHLWRGGGRKAGGEVHSHRKIHNARNRGRPFPLAKSTTPATRASIPPRKINNARNAGVNSPSPFMERGVADRPGVRSEAKQ